MSWLLTPFRDNGRLTNVQLHYNYTHSSIRSTVERAFGLFKGRFTRLQHINQNEMEGIVQTVVTGCILHNICVINNDNFQELLNEDPVPQLVGAENFDEHQIIQGSVKRLQIARALLFKSCLSYYIHVFMLNINT